MSIYEVFIIKYINKSLFTFLYYTMLKTITENFIDSSIWRCNKNWLERNHQEKGKKDRNISNWHKSENDRKCSSNCSSTRFINWWEQACIHIHILSKRIYISQALKNTLLQIYKIPVKSYKLVALSPLIVQVVKAS